MQSLYNDLLHHCPDGVYIMPTETDEIFDGVYFVQKGLYAHSILRFRIINMELQFKTEIFHPLVHPLTQKLEHPVLDTLLELVQYLQGVLEVDSLECFGEKTEQWKEKVSKSVQNSQLFIYEEPDSSIVFTPWDRENHQKVLDSMLYEHNKTK
jgi:hypothetical protein